jgi:hypothetical protein
MQDDWTILLIVVRSANALFFGGIMKRRKTAVNGCFKGKMPALKGALASAPNLPLENSAMPAWAGLQSGRGISYELGVVPKAIGTTPRKMR